MCRIRRAKNAENSGKQVGKSPPPPFKNCSAEPEGPGCWQAVEPNTPQALATTHTTHYLGFRPSAPAQYVRAPQPSMLHIYIYIYMYTHTQHIYIHLCIFLNRNNEIVTNLKVSLQWHWVLGTRS